MGRNKIHFSERTKEIFKKLHREKLIHDEAFYLFFDCKNYKQLEESLLKYFSIKEKETDLVWKNCRNKWKDKRDGEQFAFNKIQNIFMRKLIDIYYGVYNRDRCQSELLTDAQISNHLPELEEEGYIYGIRFRGTINKRTIYILNPKLKL